MLRDVTIGQYYNADSIVHRLDPRVKIWGTVWYILMLLFDRNLPQFLILTGMYVVVLCMAKVPFAYAVKGLRSIGIVVLIFSLFNAFSVAGTTVFAVGSLKVTREGLEKSGFVFWRMVLLVLFTSILMYTTTATDLTEGLKRSFHLSANVAMTATIALRFVPIIFAELRQIMRAQEARGVNFKTGNVKERLKKIRNIIIPLIRNSVRRAGNLGDAMDARCYNGDSERSSLKVLKYGTCDIIALMALLILTALLIFIILKF